MSKRVYQGYTLFETLKAAKPGEYVSKEVLAKALKVNAGSIPVYLIGLREWFNVEVKAHKDGRSVVGYELVTRDAEIPMYGRRGAAAATKATKPKTKKASKVTVAKTKTTQVKAKSKNAPVEIEDLDVEEITDTELSDIKSQLGLA